MDLISIHDINKNVPLISIADTAMFLNLTERNLVDEILESFTDCTDVDIIQEIVDTLNLPLTCVIETTQNDLIIHGYIRGGDLV